VVKISSFGQQVVAEAKEQDVGRPTIGDVPLVVATGGGA
jgi:hypothetical protein